MTSLWKQRITTALNSKTHWYLTGLRPIGLRHALHFTGACLTFDFVRKKLLIPVILLLVLGAAVFYFLKHNDADDWPPVYDNLVHAEAARDKVRAEHPELFEKVSAAMYKEDLIDIDFGDNPDEYDPEAGTVIPRLKDCQNADDVATVLHEEYILWFDEEIAGTRESYENLGNTIWGIWIDR